MFLPPALARAAVFLLALFLMFPAQGAGAAQSDAVARDTLSARLITAEDGVARQTGALSAGLEIDLRKGWHAYWRAPGEVGLPPEIDWQGSENIASTQMLWPAPTRFRAFGIENFGYENKLVLPINIRLDEPGAPARLHAQVSLLVCSDICVPEQFLLTLDLPGGSGGVDQDAAAKISKWAAKVPDDGGPSGLTAGVAAFDAAQEALVITARSAVPFDAPDLFPELDAFPKAAFGAPDIRLGDRGRLMWARMPVLTDAITDAKDVPELSVTITDGDRAATLRPQAAEQAPPPPFTLAQVVPGIGQLAWIAALGVLGGLILNVMPCVLPVLSIKLSSAVKSHGAHPARVRGGFLMSALGVLSFMWVLAAATLATRALGMSVGWGLQFQNPVFLSLMIVILTIFSANLLGLFEISLPWSWQSRLSRADGSPGYLGDFATGAFAAVLATPCSAPFLGTAVAFALAGRAVDVVVIFTAMGIGLALPYLVVAIRPALVGRLPRPGRWMVVLKMVLGALLALTALWLFWVLDGVSGPWAVLSVAALMGITIALLALRLPGLAPGLRAGALTLVAGAALVAPALVPAPAPMRTAASETAQWQVFDRAEIARHVAAGKTVFVDVTADWCLTCKANKALVLDRAPVAGALRGENVVPLRADWTRPDESISRYLASFDRYGIPFNAVYGPGAPEGIALPEILNAQTVLDALERAGRHEVAQGG
ncbi:MAG: copper-binding protein [Sediminimonas qiaohouensis]|uniref:Copper-binding protein n=1 Tax=Sediminimonas qiaohouensis TaxID=552061 RepID=A0A7C9HM18_9RHOB|nr:protein-disulfide reductase DsbD domain-containing protein [Sediminimonas qiaohouensis]MTJ04203.1 copper-binding protein [Sediminimonas qiaohouensis]